MLNSKSYSLGLIGYPLFHSLSPRLHCAALRSMRLAGDYRLYLVLPLPEGEESLLDLLGRMKTHKLQGLNVTIPHKRTIIPYLDELSPTASAIGAVNTITLKHGLLVGENTDAPGFLSNLESFLKLTTVKGYFLSRSEKEYVVEKNALLLGAGGAARAVTHALVCAGWEVTIAARRLDQAKEIAANLQLSTSSLQSTVQSLAPLPATGSVHAVSLNKSSIIDLKPTIIVNCTPAGTWPEVSANPWPEGAPFPTGALVYDLVYNPAETELMRTARMAGLPVANGLGMLIEQAALALETWTGQSTPRQPMWEAATEFQGPMHVDF